MEKSLFLPSRFSFDVPRFKFHAKIAPLRILKALLHSFLVLGLLLRSLMTFFFFFLILCSWSFFPLLKTIKIFFFLPAFWNFMVACLIVGVLFSPFLPFIVLANGGTSQSEDLCCPGLGHFHVYILIYFIPLLFLCSVFWDLLLAVCWASWFGLLSSFFILCFCCSLFWEIHSIWPSNSST